MCESKTKLLVAEDGLFVRLSGSQQIIKLLGSYVLFGVFSCSGLGSPLIPLFCFITVFVIIRFTIVFY